MIDEYLRQMLVTDHIDPTYTVIISSFDINEECDHETMTLGLTQYNPSVYDLFKRFYINIRNEFDTNITPVTEENLFEDNQEATRVVDDFLNENLVINNRQLILRSGLEYDNDHKLYRSVLNATLVDALPGSETQVKCVIQSKESDIFVFADNEEICIPLFLKTDYNEGLEDHILMVTLMDWNKNNVFQNKIVLVTDRNGHALYYPTVLPTEQDKNAYIAGDESDKSFYYNDGVPRYKYYMQVDYFGTKEYAPVSKMFTIYIAKGAKTHIDKEKVIR